MEEELRVPIILDRPFLATARAVINVKNGILLLNISENIIEFDLSASLKKPSFARLCYTIDVVEKAVECSNIA